MVLLLCKLHGLTVSACVSKQQRNRDQEVVIVVMRLFSVDVHTDTNPSSFYTRPLWTDPSPQCVRHKWMIPCRLEHIEVGSTVETDVAIQCSTSLVIERDLSLSMPTV